jgi:hypothetical protein
MTPSIRTYRRSVLRPSLRSTAPSSNANRGVPVQYCRNSVKPILLIMLERVGMHQKLTLGRIGPPEMDRLGRSLIEVYQRSLVLPPKSNGTELCA